MARVSVGGSAIGCWLLAVVASGGAGGASNADAGAAYARGIKAAKADHWKSAIPELEAFTGQACAGAQPDRRCREAYLALGRGYERRGTPVPAWVAFDTALALPPHARDAAVREDLQRA